MKEGENVEFEDWLNSLPVYINIEDAAKITGIGRNAIRNLINAHSDKPFIISCGKQGKQKLIKTREFVDWFLTLTYI